MNDINDVKDKQLRSYYWICKEITQLEQELGKLADGKNSLDGYSDGIDDMKANINMKLYEALKARGKIENYIDNVQDIEMRVILRFRYIYMMTWEQVGKEIFMSSSGVFRKCKKFLDTYEDKLIEEDGSE